MWGRLVRLQVIESEGLMKRRRSSVQTRANSMSNRVQIQKCCVHKTMCECVCLCAAMISWSIHPSRWNSCATMWLFIDLVGSSLACVVTALYWQQMHQHIIYNNLNQLQTCLIANFNKSFSSKPIKHLMTPGSQMKKWKNLLLLSSEHCSKFNTLDTVNSILMSITQFEEVRMKSSLSEFELISFGESG